MNSLAKQMFHFGEVGTLKNLLSLFNSLFLFKSGTMLRGGYRLSETPLSKKITNGKSSGELLDLFGENRESKNSYLALMIYNRQRN